MEKHARLGASNASRWMQCPGSVRMTDGLPRKTTSYAAEGIAAHALAEKCLCSLPPENAPPLYLGETIDGVVVTEDMCESVQKYLSFLSDHCPGGIHVETFVSLEKLSPPEPMFGTADAVFYCDGTLTVVDYKHGAGVAVDATDNPQLRYYALGAMLTFTYRVTDVEIVIVQPRAEHPDGPIRRERISAFDLLEWGAELLDSAKSALEPDAPLQPGACCRFCDAAPMCPALKKQTTKIARTEFSGTSSAPPGIEKLTVRQMSECLAQAELIETWFRSLRKHLTSVLESGSPVPGFKLVPKRAVRKWADYARLTSWASGEGVSAQLFNAPEMKSPAQLEKSLGKNRVPKELIVKNSSGMKLVPESDPRPAQAISPAAEFFIDDERGKNGNNNHS